MKKLLAGLLSFALVATTVTTPLGESISALAVTSLTSSADEATSLKTWTSDASTKASAWWGDANKDPFAVGGDKDKDGNPVKYPLDWSQAKSLEVNR